MTKYSKDKNVSEKTKDDAMKIARGTQKPGQSKEQTKLIAQGIQKGIEQYKKTQSAKKRELDKKLSNASAKSHLSESAKATLSAPVETKGNRLLNKLPWVLLFLSWLGFVAYVY